MFKLDKKNNKLLYNSDDMAALQVNLFRGYAREFGGVVVNAKESEKYFLNKLNGRAWFKPLNDNQKKAIVIFIMSEYAKGFNNE